MKIIINSTVLHNCEERIEKMSNNVIELLEIINNSPDPERAIIIASQTIAEYLAQQDNKQNQTVILSINSKHTNSY